MLCRTASDLFWIGRLVERAESMARLLDLARRLSALPGLRDGKRVHKAWTLPLLATGSLSSPKGLDNLRREEILFQCVLDRENPGSVISCIQMARDAARNQRSVVPAEVHTSLHAMLGKINSLNARSWNPQSLGQTLLEIQNFSDVFRGIGFATMLRNESWHFLRLGSLFERADASIRLWSTQSDPDFEWQTEQPDGPLAAFHRVALLEVASALMPLRRLRGEANLDGVSEMLLRRTDFPRSASYCLMEASRHLNALGVDASESVSRALGRAQAGVSFAEIGNTPQAMFDFGAARLAEIATTQRELDQRFFVANLMDRRKVVANTGFPLLKAA